MEDIFEKIINFELEGVSNFKVNTELVRRCVSHLCDMLDVWEEDVEAELGLALAEAQLFMAVEYELTGTIRKRTFLKVLINCINQLNIIEVTADGILSEDKVLELFATDKVIAELVCDRPDDEDVKLDYLQQEAFDKLIELECDKLQCGIRKQFGLLTSTPGKEYSFDKWKDAQGEILAEFEEYLYGMVEEAIDANMPQEEEPEEDEVLSYSSLMRALVAISSALGGRSYTDNSPLKVTFYG